MEFAILEFAIMLLKIESFVAYRIDKVLYNNKHALGTNIIIDKFMTVTPSGSILNRDAYRPRALHIQLQFT